MNKKSEVAIRKHCLFAECVYIALQSKSEGCRAYDESRRSLGVGD